MATGSEVMELGSDENNSHSLSENDQHLTRVVGGASGEGLPYAPENWPNDGDVWKWKVGWRKSKSGFWLDRYLYLPDCLQEGRKRSFKSKFAVKSYLEKEFPNVDVNTFFASFSWKIPCANNPALAEVNDARETVPIIEDPDPDLEVVGHEIVSVSEYSDPSFDAMGCKAGNRLCDAHLQTRDSTLEPMECNICCKEVEYCRDCCCMLCFKIVDWVHGGYSFFRCEARVNEMYICGHAAHISCALRCYMAGTVGGSIGLDAEYYCRHCYNKSDLIGHVTSSLQTCKSLESRDEVMKILNIGLCILRGSRRMAAETLRYQIELMLTQLKSGVDLKDIWRTKDQIPTDSAGDMPLLENLGRLVGELGFARADDSPQVANDLRGDQIPDYLTTYSLVQPAKLGNDIYSVLHTLQKQQESEYGVAEQKLFAHKDLDSILPVPANFTSFPSNCYLDPNPAEFSGLVDQIKRDFTGLQQMMEIRRGFGRTPKSILREHFDLLVEEWPGSRM